jgi:hypothetical protein
MPDLPIGYRRFTDGTTRPIFRDQAGREYVLEDDGQPVHGVWLDPGQADADDPGDLAGETPTIRLTIRYRFSTATPLTPLPR